jgi:hypothetical protein
VVSVRFFGRALGNVAALDAHADWLKLAFPVGYRGSANRIEVSVPARASFGAVFSEAERHRGIEKRNKELLALADKDGAR